MGGRLSKGRSHPSTLDLGSTMASEMTDNEALLKDLLFETNLPLTKVAEELGYTQYKLNKRIKQLGLSWVKRHYRKMSRGHAALFKIMENLLPGDDVVAEHHVGEGLMLDIYASRYKVAAEYHGRQHFEYVDYFHRDNKDFIDAQQRDIRKEELCREQGIALIVFRYNDTLTEEAVFDRLLDAIRITPHQPKVSQKHKFKGNPYYEKMQQRKREHNKIQYRKLKKKRHKRKKNGRNK